MKSESRHLGIIEYSILLLLTKHNNYIYGLSKEIKTVTDDKLKISNSSLYDSIRRLIKRGYVREFMTEVIDGRARVIYCITTEGLDKIKKYELLFSKLNSEKLKEYEKGLYQ